MPARFFSREDNLIIKDDDVWIPVETTMLDSGFITAWSEGAREWREHNRVDSADFYPTHDALEEL